MNKKDVAYSVINRLEPEELDAFLVLFAKPSDYIEEEEPDEYEKKMIEEYEKSKGTETTVSLDDFVRELGFDPNELRVQDQ